MFWLLLTIGIMYGMWRAHHKEWNSIANQQAKLDEERRSLTNYHRALDEWSKIMVASAQGDPNERPKL